MMKRPEFTKEQEYWLCSQLDHWYYEWKGKITNGEPHCLGVAKEQLKHRLCELEIDKTIENIIRHSDE